MVWSDVVAVTAEDSVYSFQVAADPLVASAQQALAMHPQSHSAVQTVAHLYTLLGRETEAHDLLEHAERFLLDGVPAGGSEI